ncbi:Glycosyltransferase family 4 protein [Rhodovastum atsumiense]|uniref:Glycosyltransferase family 4 protein n=1 Tax=Rhodovastum atsumiense TaxID=504468 RepID=A0A5M6IRN1_9PROT|nr:glycosyltransferase family 4 protein [Rhodovastum atsumiense]KAA5610946.1 glycosyltransferase family 4 protein [Rhodovastum atsumiense]CAH2601478.1 Glycosyltransferase family 4 protein [Rhodovastum atsumiense]
MKVVIVANAYPPHVVGGAELVAAYLAEGLAQRGDEVTVVSTCSAAEGSTEEMLNGVHVLRFFPRNLWWNLERFAAGDRRSLPARLAWNLRDSWNPDSAGKFAAVLARVRPDIVHTHNLKGLSPSLWREAARLRIPIVHTTHDYWLLCARGTMLRRDGGACTRRCLSCEAYGRWYAACARPIDVLCSPSRFVLERHLAHGFGQGRRTEVIANGIPLAPRPRPTRSADAPLRVLYIGQLRREKGVQVLLAALPLLRGDVVIDIAGSGELEAEVTAAAARHTRLRVHGYVTGPAKAALLAAADVLAFPSIWSENAPIAIVEALLHGMPVVGSDLGAIPEFVQPRGADANGLLFPMGDAAGLAAALDRLAANRALLAALSAGASRQAPRYTAGTMVQSYRRLYATLAHAGAEAVEKVA